MNPSTLLPTTSASGKNLPAGYGNGELPAFGNNGFVKNVTKTALNAAQKEALATEKTFQLSQALVNRPTPDGKDNWLSRKFSNFVALDESVLGASAILFLQDTLAVWLPKMTAMRSVAEAVETTFLEFVESALFYFSAPILGQHVFSKLVKKWGVPDNDNPKAPDYLRRYKIGDSLGKINEKVNLDKLSKELNHGVGITKAGTLAKKAIGLKAGTVIATMSALALEYTLSFAKNLITLKFFNTGDFNEVANLKDGEVVHKSEKQIASDKAIEAKSIKRLWQGALAAAGLFAAGLGVARGATKSKTIFNFSRNLLKTFDFKYHTVFARKGQGLGKTIKSWFSKTKPETEYIKDEYNRALPKLTTKFGLTKGQKIAIITLGGIGYLDASRNKLEIYENLFRVWGVVMPYLMFGKEFLTERLRRILHGEVKLPKILSPLQPSQETIAKFRQIYKWNPDANNGKGAGEYLSMNDIVKKSLAKSPELAKEYENTADPLLIRSWANSNNPEMRKVGQEFRRLMGPKKVSFAAPLFFGIFGVGLTVAWLNRFWTAYRYNKQQQDKLAINPQPLKEASRINLSGSNPFQNQQLAAIAINRTLATQQQH